MAKKPIEDEAMDSPFKPVVEAFSRDNLVTRDRMFGSTCLKVKGKVFALFYKGKFVAK